MRPKSAMGPSPRRNTVSRSECHMGTIRRATVADAAILARHRVEMFREMGQLIPGLSGPLFEASRAYFVEAIPAERYIGWVYESSSGPEAVIGGGGGQVRELPPPPAPAGPGPGGGPPGDVLHSFPGAQRGRSGGGQSLL